MEKLLEEILMQHEVAGWTAERTLEEVRKKCPRAKGPDPDSIKNQVQTSFRKNGGLTGKQLVSMVMDIAKPGMVLRNHETFKRVFDKDCNAAFRSSETSMRNLDSFIESIFQGIVLGNLHVVLQKASTRIFDIIGYEKRCEENDAFYSANDVWCIASGTEGACTYGTGLKAIHGFAVSPCGWLRLALSVDEKDWANWHRAYHGTVGKNLENIIDIGLIKGDGRHGKAGAKGKSVIYCSPSIEYAAHYLYAGAEQPIKPVRETPRETKEPPARVGSGSLVESLVGNVIFNDEAHAQFVFEVRVRPGKYRVQGNTLASSLWPDAELGSKRLPFETRCMSENLEWIVDEPEDIVCTGVMLRTLKSEPCAYNKQRIEEMMKHVGWSTAERKCTRPRNYGGVKAGQKAVWEYNGAREGTLSYEDSGGDWVRYSDELSAIIEGAYQGYQRFAFLGVPKGAPGPYVVDFGSECDAALKCWPEQRRADSDKEQTWRRRAVRRRAA